MNEITTTVTGQLAHDVELRYTATGDAVANFTVAATRRAFDKSAGEWQDADTVWMRCTLWRQAAVNLAESLRKGDRVIVTGRLRQRSFETSAGEKRTVVELDAYEVGASLQFRPVTFDRTSPSTSSARESQLVGSGSDDEPPF